MTMTLSCRFAARAQAKVWSRAESASNKMTLIDIFGRLLVAPGRPVTGRAGAQHASNIRVIDVSVRRQWRCADAAKVDHRDVIANIG
ncbi:hypothetical protein [Micromonospora sp. NPDC003816]|uniref:hypothetical protein n=1 Tax=Micromonospora sp. NPDC003816 TaxID=3364224 RepID=UPI0036A09FF5